MKGKKDPYQLEKLPLVLMPTYPSSGSEYGLGAVAADSRTNDFGTAYGIPADYAILVPKYSMSLDQEMAAYTALVTLVQLSALRNGLFGRQGGFHLPQRGESQHRDLKPDAAGASSLSQMPPAAFSVHRNRMFCIWKLANN